MARKKPIIEKYLKEKREKEEKEKELNYYHRKERQYRIEDKYDGIFYEYVLQEHGSLGDGDWELW